MSRYESIYPAKLKKGDTVGVVAPSSPFDVEKFKKGISILENMGFHVHVPDEIWGKNAYLAGSDQTRAETVNRMFMSPDIKGIVCARGGYGAMRILEYIDKDLVMKHPKRFIGFSDITVLLSFFYHECGIVPFHGPMVCSLGSSDDDSLKAFHECLTLDACKEFNLEPGRAVVRGRAEGKILGGNLASLCHMTGTPYEPDFSGSILMIEDICEPPYKLDRMLTQLKIAGKFKRIKAVVAGLFENCGQVEEHTAVLTQIFAGYGIPVVVNAGFGHGKTNRAFPIGVHGEIDTDHMKMVFK